MDVQWNRFESTQSTCMEVKLEQNQQTEQDRLVRCPDRISSRTLIILNGISGFRQSPQTNVFKLCYDHFHPYFYQFIPHSHSIILCYIGLEMDVLYLRWLVAGFPQRLLGFDPRSDYVRFVVDKVTLVAGLLRVLRFTLPVLILTKRNLMQYLNAG
jgi:hypothetical protein